MPVNLNKNKWSTVEIQKTTSDFDKALQNGVSKFIKNEQKNIKAIKVNKDGDFLTEMNHIKDY